MDFSTSIWVLCLSLGMPAFILFLIGLFFIKKEKDRKNNCTGVVKGKVKRYTFWSNEGIFFPIAEYEVNNTKYTQRLRYTSIVFKSKPLNAIQAEVVTDVSDTVLRVYRNTLISFNPMKESFPIGSEIDVYFNPKNPKKSYVLRYAKNIIGDVFMFCACFFAFLGIALFVTININALAGMILLFVVAFIALPIGIIKILLQK